MSRKKKSRTKAKRTAKRRVRVSVRKRSRPSIRRKVARRTARRPSRAVRSTRRLAAIRKASKQRSRPQPIAEELPPQRPVFSKSELRLFRQLLLTQKANLAGGIQQIAKEASKSQRETAGDLSTYTYHMADVASDTYDRELSLNIASSEQKVLYQIEEALKRVDEGSYGRCLDCNKPVPQTRLKAVPYAALCIACQRQREDKRHK